MASGFHKGVRGVAVLALAAFVATMPIAAAFAADATSLIVVDPLPGYTLAEAGELNGAIDAGSLMELAGSDSADVPDEVRELAGEARTWRNDEGSTAVAFVIDCGDVSTASGFLRGALDGSTESSDSTFDSGLAGSAGFTVEVEAMPVHSVIWRQDKYYVEVFVVDVNGDTSDAKALAARQASFLQSNFGGVPTLSTSSAAADSDETSVAYQIGRLSGTLFLVGFVAFLISNGRKRRAERQAYEARVAGPPPVFPVRTPMPAPLRIGLALPPPPLPPPPPPPT